MMEAGIDTSIFAPHLTRSAACGKATTKLPLVTLVRTAGWSRESTFRQYYDKPVDTKYDFGQAVLQNHADSDSD